LPKTRQYVWAFAPRLRSKHWRSGDSYRPPPPGTACCSKPPPQAAAVADSLVTEDGHGHGVVRRPDDAPCFDIVHPAPRRQTSNRHRRHRGTAQPTDFAVRSKGYAEDKSRTRTDTGNHLRWQPRGRPGPGSGKAVRQAVTQRVWTVAFKVADKNIKKVSWLFYYWVLLVINSLFWLQLLQKSKLLSMSKISTWGQMSIGSSNNYQVNFSKKFLIRCLSIVNDVSSFRLNFKSDLINLDNISKIFRIQIHWECSEGILGERDLGELPHMHFKQPEKTF